MKRNDLFSVLILSCSFMIAGTITCYGEYEIPPDRKINWDPGVPGGIPTFNTQCGQDVNADTTGQRNAQPIIQDAIDACLIGQFVKIPAGQYRLDSQLIIPKGIVLRGDGPSATILQTYASSHGIRMGNYPSAPVAIQVSGSPAKGATQVTVALKTPLSLAVGDYIVIDQINDGVEVKNVDEDSRDNGSRALSQITRITGINGLTLTIDPPLYHAYSARQKPEIWKLNPVTTYAGIEDLAIERVNTDQTDYYNILMVATAYSWIKNIESKNALFRHVDLARSFRNTVRDSYFNDGQYHNSGGFAYGVVASNRSTANLVENNIFYHLRHSMVIKEGAAGNVFGYNYSLASDQGENWLAADINAHGAHTHMNLFEGNIVAQIYGDFTHGSSSYNTFFRNHAIRESSWNPTITNFLHAVDVEKFNYYYNFVGNVLGKPNQTWTAYEDDGTRTASEPYAYCWGYPTPGSGTSTDPKSKATALRHCNYDYAMGSTDCNPLPTLPASLYLTAKPTFFGDSPWPSIGPDVSTCSNANPCTIPAKVRYEGM